MDNTSCTYSEDLKSDGGALIVRLQVGLEVVQLGMRWLIRSCGTQKTFVPIIFCFPISIVLCIVVGLAYTSRTLHAFFPFQFAMRGIGHPRPPMGMGSKRYVGHVFF